MFNYDLDYREFVFIIILNENDKVRNKKNLRMYS